MVGFSIGIAKINTGKDAKLFSPFIPSLISLSVLNAKGRERYGIKYGEQRLGMSGHQLPVVDAKVEGGCGHERYLGSNSIIF